MGHSISAVILRGEFSRSEAAKYDLIENILDFDLTMFFIDGYYSACWQKRLNSSGCLETNCKEISWFPREYAIYRLMELISNNPQVQYAIIQTDYHGGVGNQYANLYCGDENINLEINTINAALKYFGVVKRNHHDEFDAVGLGKFRVNPDYLEKYRDIADELGV